MKVELHVQEKKATMLPTLDVLGMEVIEIDHVPALRSGMEMLAGLVVKKVRWGGVADQSGVATGDIIAEVDGQAVRTINDLKNSLAVHEGREPLRFLFRRVGTTRYLALPCEGGLPGEYSRLDAFQMFGRFTS
jgi:S1-C subfamily serine protease